MHPEVIVRYGRHPLFLMNRLIENSGLSEQEKNILFMARGCNFYAAFHKPVKKYAIHLHGIANFYSSNDFSFDHISKNQKTEQHSNIPLNMFELLAVVQTEPTLGIFHHSQHIISSGVSVDGNIRYLCYENSQKKFHVITKSELREMPHSHTALMVDVIGAH